MKTLIVFFIALSSFSKVWAVDPLCLKFFEGKRVMSVAAEKSWSQQIFLNELSHVKAFLKKLREVEESEKLAYILEQDIRRTLFSLEYEAKMLKNFDKSFFEPLLIDFKAAEDAIGKVSLYASLAKTAKGLNEDKLEKYFESLRDEHGERVLDMMAQLEGVDRVSKEKKEAKDKKVKIRSLSEIEKELKEYKKWLTGPEDREFWSDVIVEDLKRIHKNAKDNEYDNKDIEKGLHELRRDLRGILIQFMLLKNFISYPTRVEIPENIREWLNEMKKKNYPRIDMGGVPTSVKTSLRIPENLTHLVESLVYEMGSFKDQAEVAIYVDEALSEMKQAEDPEIKITKEDEERISRKIKGLGEPQSVDHQQLARGYEDRLEETKLLKIFAQSIKYLNE